MTMTNPRRPPPASQRTSVRNSQVIGSTVGGSGNQVTNNEFTVTTGGAEDLATLRRLLADLHDQLATVPSPDPRETAARHEVAELAMSVAKAEPEATVVRSRLAALSRLLPNAANVSQIVSLGVALFGVL
jgi:hypothetical protein